MSTDKKSELQQIAELVSDKTTLYINQEDIPLIDFSQGGQTLLKPISSQSSEDLIRKLVHDELEIILRNNDMRDLLSHLSSLAKLSSNKINTAQRIFHDENNIYVDLANQSNDTIQITEEGWNKVETEDVHFIRSPKAQALPEPVEGGELSILKDKYLNLGSIQDWYLVLTYIVSILFSPPSKPLLVVNGHQGSAKSTLSKVIRKIIDPSLVMVEMTPDTQDNLVLTAKNSTILCIDNASALSTKMMNYLCQLCTGLGYSKRKHYSDLDEIIVNITRNVIINGIDPDMIKASDLLSRTIQIMLPTIPSENRISETQLWNDFDNDLPKILGALYTLASKVLACIDSVTVENPTRLTDFCHIGTAVEQSMGWPKNSFMDAMHNSQTESQGISLEYNLVGNAISIFMQRHAAWKGTAQELFNELANLVSKRDLVSPKWPISVNSLGRKLPGLMPQLATQGIEIEKVKSGQRYIQITNKNYSARPETDLYDDAYPHELFTAQNDIEFDHAYEEQQIQERQYQEYLVASQSPAVPLTEEQRMAQRKRINANINKRRLAS